MVQKPLAQKVQPLQWGGSVGVLFFRYESNVGPWRAQSGYMVLPWCFHGASFVGPWCARGLFMVGPS